MIDSIAALDPDSETLVKIFYKKPSLGRELRDLSKGLVWRMARPS
ncbi:hypothetical protein [Clostridium sp. BNL1100]|nr:hypothetical protein [Clostridium sp. BNL1100]